MAKSALRPSENDPGAVWRANPLAVPFFGAVLSFAFLLPAPASPDETAKASAEPRVAWPIPAKSHSGRFYVLAPDNALKLMLIRWAEEVTGRVERLVGAEVGFKGWSVRIVVTEDTDAEAGRLRLSRSVRRSHVIDQLTINHYDEIQREEADEALCRILIRAYAQPWRNSVGAAPTIPEWLSLGLAQNLYPSLRARNSRAGLKRWQEGRLPTTVEFLRLEPSAQGADKETSGLLVAWLLSQPGKDARFEMIFRRVAAGEAVTAAWLVTLVSGCESIGDLEEKWDHWLWKQRRIVYEPGEVYPEHMDQLKAALLLYPEVSGIRVEGSGERPLQPSDLIDIEDRETLAEAAGLVAARLRALAIGRGETLVEVVEAYCRFFEALPTAKRKGKLGKLLTEAEDKRLTLECELEARDPVSVFPAEAEAREEP